MTAVRVALDCPGDDYLPRREGGRRGTSMGMFTYQRHEGVSGHTGRLAVSPSIHLAVEGNAGIRRGTCCCMAKPYGNQCSAGIWFHKAPTCW